MLGMSREEAEGDLARALSRHIGYTTGAFDLRRIFSVVEVFRTEASAYGAEIVEKLELATGEKALSAGYIEGIIDFATAFGLIETVSNRESKLSRYAATELGRSVLGVLADEDAAFRNHYLATVVMAADADYQVPLMLHVQGNSEAQLEDFFSEFVMDLRQRRLTWLCAVLNQPVLLERVASRIAWLKKGKGGIVPFIIKSLEASTVRHHSRPRLGWLRDLGLLDRQTNALTPFGYDMLWAIVGDSPYFWIGPGEAAMATLAIDDPAGRAIETDLGLTSPSSTLPTESELQTLASDTANLMFRAFTSAKLIHAEQASLRLPIGYIQYRAYRDNRHYDWASVLAGVFETERNRLRRYSAHKGQIGFYKVVSG